MGAKEKGVSLRALWLGQQLRELRERTGRTMADVGEYLQRSAATVSRFETADYPVRQAELLALLDLYNVSDQAKRDGLLKLSEEVWRKGWWEGYTDTVDPRFIDYAWLESRADKLRIYETMLVPGLLQTRDYAKALIKHGARDAATDQIEQWISFRMTRQQTLYRDEPLHLDLVLDEAVLYRVIGGPEVLRAQFDQVRKLMERPNIDVRVVPFRGGAHAGVDGPFKVFEMSEPYPEVGYIETPAGSIYVEDGDADKLTRMYDELWTDALDSAQTAELISAVANDLTAS